MITTRYVSNYFPFKNIDAFQELFCGFGTLSLIFTNFAQDDRAEVHLGPVGIDKHQLWHLDGRGDVDKLKLCLHDSHCEGSNETDDSTKKSLGLLNK